MEKSLIIVSILKFALCEDQLQFPDSFMFGVATSAYQIEGGWNELGKGPNIWDTFTHSHPEKIKDNSTGDVACDSFHLWRRDVQMLTELNVSFYRFSISWSRILPKGLANERNQAGIDYYSHLINELIRFNIQPLVTLYHWDLPQALQDLGGWTNPETAHYFKEYAEVCFEAFGDRVKRWITINEPLRVCLDYEANVTSPQTPSPGIGCYLCGKTALLAHAKTYHLYYKKFKKCQKGQISISLDSAWYFPKKGCGEDQEAVDRAMQMSLGWFAHPIYSKAGDYPPLMRCRIQNVSVAEGYPTSRLPPLTSKEVKLIRGTSDFFALNHYTSRVVTTKECKAHEPSYDKDICINTEVDEKWPNSTLEWLKVVPDGFRALLNWVKEEYGNIEIVVTENGFADDGSEDDVDRFHFYKDYLTALLYAIRNDKVNVTGYTAWSLMDNMEWSKGYTVKFGLYKVDFNSATRTRSMKGSASFYSKLIKERIIPQVCH